MFKKMETTAIPERVYALCKIVEKEPLTIEQVKEEMEPRYLENNTLYFSGYRLAAEELNLISINDGKIYYVQDKSVIKDIKSLRQFINTKLESLNDGNFYKVTKEYFGQSSKILTGPQNVAEMANGFAEITESTIDAAQMRAWRFWASYLGFGYLHEMFIIPNADVFLWDLIKTSDLEKKKMYSISDFINHLRPYCNILIQSELISKELNLAVSNGLRTLHDQKKISLSSIKDESDFWTLVPFDTHDIKRVISHIEILR